MQALARRLRACVPPVSHWYRQSRFVSQQVSDSATDSSSVQVRWGIPSNREPSYILPYYGAGDDEISALSDDKAKQVLKVYGGLIRKGDTGDDWRDRLRKLTRAWHMPKQLTIFGVVVSNKMKKSVVIAAKRRAYNSKLDLPYFKTRRFMAHDELDLCRPGDHVIIRSCRPLSKQKTHVVVINYGDKSSTEVDDRRVIL